MIGVVDYKAGNLFSVINSLKSIGANVKIVRVMEDMDDIDKLILPGVGAFGPAMNRLSESGMSELIIDWIFKGRPFLGICLGLQLLFEFSEESPDVKGLCLLKGSVKRFNCKKVPHIGWNLARVSKRIDFSKSLKDEYFYFVHSYYVEPEEDITLFSTEYSIEFVSGIQKENIVAVQFHPEKSANSGINFLKKWIELC